MRRQDFYFELPQELIAQEPLAERTASRLLVLDGQSGAVTHRQFTDILDWLEPKDLLVFNNTKVIPARLWGQKTTGGRVEIMIERLRGDGAAVVHLRASKTPKPGACIHVTPGEQSDITDVSIRVIDREGALFIVALEEGLWPDVLQRYGHIPLPPYIEREDTREDRQRYQTVFAKKEGAVAAPTAGLHFDQWLLNDLRAKGVAMTELTLHVGAGTFQPVRVDDIREHTMHSEYLEVSEAVVNAVNACRERGGRVVAVGTTAVRSLETAAQGGSLEPFRGESDIFIYPGKRFNAVDAMITNFHLPESTLVMLVSAFAGRTQILTAYQEAIRQRYRFFSYGDAMLITPQSSARPTDPGA